MTGTSAPAEGLFCYFYMYNFSMNAFYPGGGLHILR